MLKVVPIQNYMTTEDVRPMCFSYYFCYQIWMKRNDIKIESVLPFAIILRMFISCLIPILFQFNSNLNSATL